MCLSAHMPAAVEAMIDPAAAAVVVLTSSSRPTRLARGRQERELCSRILIADCCCKLSDLGGKNAPTEVVPKAFKTTIDIRKARKLIILALALPNGST